MRELGTITGYTGLMGLAIAFCFPPMLYLSSHRKAVELGVSTRSQYETFPFSSSLLAARSMLAFGSVSIFLVLFLFLTAKRPE